MSYAEKVWLKQYPSTVPSTIDYPNVLLTQFLIDAARDFPKRDAVLFMGKKLTYEQLLEESYRFANSLKELGVRPQERVAIMLPNCPQAVIAYYGALFIGAVVVQTNPLYMERELEHQLTDSGSETIICLDLVLPKVQNVKSKTQLKRVIVTSIKDYLPFPKNVLYPLTLWKDGIKLTHEYDKDTHAFKRLIAKALPTPVTPPETDPIHDVALLQYTGGTTGLSKAAMLTHRNLIVNSIQASYWLYKVKRGTEKILGVLPFFHVYGMTVVMNYAMYQAATMILIPRFDCEMILKTIVKERPTLFPGAPTMYVAIINHPNIQKYDLSSIDACVSGSAALPVEVQEKFEKLTGGRLIEGYGMTETSPVTHSNLVWDRVRSSTIGVPWPDTESRVVDAETGEELPVGEIGELQVRGPQVMKGYWNREDETAKVLTADGWLSTGDIVRMDEEGYFFVMDRKKDMIIAGGYNIYPREVEEVLFEHPAIQEAAVVGVPHPYRGETVKAFIVLKPGVKLTEKELDQYCREKLAKYKIPRLYEFRDELPKTFVGKVLRRVLQEQEKKKYEEEIKEAN
ncbi:long-chain-fatty-acid--CoA ligase [Baia soyae]|uniref:Long-chain acyl-CoA synthetase n=1 Tax=Baia soyae TaxID=1544746 RepID=A0A4R2S5B9_9BACL|nr:long-chain fatty acid--CoA ligase [Baia soyae]TCP66455.1 long-chain acyl-CoA synthetase [Baia soyae]